MNLTKKFLHRIDIYKPDTDHYGDVSLVTVDTSVQCFILGNDERLIQHGWETYMETKTVYFLPTASLDVGYVVQDGVNRVGEELLDKAVVVAINKIGKPKYALKLLEVKVKSDATANV